MCWFPLSYKNQDLSELLIRGANENNPIDIWAL